MNKAALIIGFLIAAMPLAAAQEVSEEQLVGEDAGMTPDNALYGFKRFGENIQLFLAFNQLEKAKLHYKLAKVRLAEAVALAKANKEDLAEKAMEEYEKILVESDSEIEKSVAQGANVTSLADSVNEETYKHVLVLQRVREKLKNERARTAIANAIERSIEKRAEVAKRVDDKELVEMTITVGNKTITKQVPARFAEKFLEKADELENKTRAELKIEHREKLKENVQEKHAEKAAERIEEARVLVNQAIEIRAQEGTTAFGLINEARKHLELAEKAFNETKYGEAFGHATASEAQARAALKVQKVKEKIEEKKTEIREKAREKLEERKEKLRERIEERKENKSATTTTSTTTVPTTTTTVATNSST